MTRTAEIRALAHREPHRAADALRRLLTDLFGFEASNIRINNDQYSLNSLNGTFDVAEGSFFFKFHQEKGEEAVSGEYYRAEILAQTGLPVDQPLHVSTLPGEQILVYHRRNDPRFSDVVRRLEFETSDGPLQAALTAERDLCQKLLKVYVATVHPITPAQAAAEPIHRLFHERMVDPVSRRFPGSRLADFYIGKRFQFPGVTLEWRDFSRLKFVINGVPYAHSIGELLEMAADRLDPRRLADGGGVVAHGDAHNANVWYAEENGIAGLRLFDPAFAGAHVPTLLAEIKPTFHNIFAHPLWLYEPAEAGRIFRGHTDLKDGLLHVDIDWRLSLIRSELLQIMAISLWQPLLRELACRRLLPSDWRSVIRLGLFLSPTLVMNLRAGAATHTPLSSLIAFSVAIMVGSLPTHGADMATEFLDLIDPGQE